MKTVCSVDYLELLGKTHCCEDNKQNPIHLHCIRVKEHISENLGQIKTICMENEEKIAPIEWKQLRSAHPPPSKGCKTVTQSKLKHECLSCPVRGRRGTRRRAAQSAELWALGGTEEEQPVLIQPSNGSAGGSGNQWRREGAWNPRHLVALSAQESAAGVESPQPPGQLCFLAGSTGLQRVIVEPRKELKNSPVVQSLSLCVVDMMHFVWLHIVGMICFMWS